MEYPVLSAVSFGSLSVGDIVQSKLTGNLGRIEQLVPKPRARRAEDNQILVRWEHGGISEYWHSRFGKVLYIGAEMNNESLDQLRTRLQKYVDDTRAERMAQYQALKESRELEAASEVTVLCGKVGSASSILAGATK